MAGAAGGPASRQRHVEEAARRGLACHVLEGSSLAFDLDTWADYREWRRDQGSAA